MKNKTKILFSLLTIVYSFGTVYAQESESSNKEESDTGITFLGWFFEWLTSGQTWVNFFVAILIIFIGWLLSKWIKWIIVNQLAPHLSGEEKDAENTARLYAGMIAGAIIIIFTLLAFTSLGIDFTFFLGWLSVGLWFALKTFIENFLAGLFVLTTKEYKIGDIVKLESKYNYIGRVEELNLRYTVMRTFDLRRVVIPNIDIVSNPIKTFSQEEVVRLQLDFSVWHMEDISAIEPLVVEAMNESEHIVKKDATKMVITHFSEFGMHCRVYYYVYSSFESAAGFVSSDMYKRLKKILDSKKVSISYPHLTLTADDNDTSMIKQFARAVTVVEKAKKRTSSNA